MTSRNKKLPLVCIIILNLNGKSFTENCLNSIQENTAYKQYRTIVVDNNSTDGSREMIKSRFKWVNLIENTENRGFSGGNNDGISWAIKRYNPDYFYLLNNDTLVMDGWLSEAIKTAEHDSKIGIVGSKQFNFDKEPTISAGWIKTTGVKYYYGDEDREVSWVSGAGFLIKKEAIMKIGLFDEMYNPAYYEETDFERRAIMAGFKIFHSIKSVFLHAGGGTTKNEKQKDYNVIFYRNRARFFSKYNPVGLIFRFFTDIIRAGGRIIWIDLVRSYFLGIKDRNKNEIKYPYNLEKNETD
ncbi:MAG: glycosyltransferase family 2 protein [Nanoarchaeota archaeon]|nr:glycosyltransferase family 2 protein [Nanoarchaeota archaeon]